MAPKAFEDEQKCIPTHLYHTPCGATKHVHLFATYIEDGVQLSKVFIEDDSSFISVKTSALQPYEADDK